MTHVRLPKIYARATRQTCILRGHGLRPPTKRNGKELIMQLFAIYCFALMSLASGQLPCSSQLRIIFPQFFTHCECHYSEWSEWVVNTTTVVDVPTYQCLNGWVLIETRTQIAVGQGCSDRKESRHICKLHCTKRM